MVYAGALRAPESNLMRVRLPPPAQMLPRKVFDTDCFVWGELLLTSGMHGNEIQVARVLKKYIELNYQKLALLK